MVVVSAIVIVPPLEVNWPLAGVRNTAPVPEAGPSVSVSAPALKLLEWVSVVWPETIAKPPLVASYCRPATAAKLLSVALTVSMCNPDDAVVFSIPFKLTLSVAMLGSARLSLVATSVPVSSE